MNDKPNPAKGNGAGIPDKLLKSYDPKETEGRIYQMWEESGFFNPDVCVEKGVTEKDAEPFTMVLPPPNVTGRLHMGHTLEYSLQDALMRYERMRGKRTLWVPGTDHAAIATQSRFEKDLTKETGKSRHDFDRDTFFGMINDFALKNQKYMEAQMRILGSSLDWSREAFTLDEAREKAVRTAFKRMYDEGLIYRGNRVVNWDPKGQTTIADDEIVYEEREAKLYTFKYGKDFPIAISTTRPETKVGDTAVAVHPDDPRYKEFVGKEYDVEFCGVPLHIKIIADPSVEMEFGTGALGVTPAHSMIDWEMAQKHDLPLIPVINEYAKMTVGDDRIMGKKTVDAREAIVAWLREEGLLEKEEAIKQNVSTAERTGGIIEPLPKLQWFIAVNKPIPSRGGKTLKELMREPIEKKEITVMPERFERVYMNWIENLRDWCISRQIIYGHRIPVWYDKDGKEYVPKETTIYLARHGESEANASGFIQGKSESPLTENGRQQAKEMVLKLKDKNIVKIISSPLARSKDTAEIVAHELGIEDVEVWDELHEIDVGNLEGAPRGTLNGKTAFETAIETGTGETLQDLEIRAKLVNDRIAKLSFEGNVLIVVHNAFYSVCKAVSANIPKEKFLIFRAITPKLQNCEFDTWTNLSLPSDNSLEQDSDTLDTWFSSGLWTFSTLGWPDETPDLKTYHPTSFMNPGYEILFFWVARMVMMSEYLLGTIPFRTVYLHGIVRDNKGQKFSKSLRNGVEPEEIIARYGTDALRMSMVVGVGPGNDVNFDEQKVKAYAKFANKIWNATRFVIENTEGLGAPDEKNLDEEDKKTYDELGLFVEEVTREMDEFKFYLVSEKVYHYFWHTFADILIERSKKKIAEGDALSARTLLALEIDTLLRLLHPFMPFITEELWSLLPEKHEHMLMVSSWPSLSQTHK